MLIFMVLNYDVKFEKKLAYRGPCEGKDKALACCNVIGSASIVGACGGGNAYAINGHFAGNSASAFAI